MIGISEMTIDRIENDNQNISDVILEKAEEKFKRSFLTIGKRITIKL